MICGSLLNRFSDRKKTIRRTLYSTCLVRSLSQWRLRQNKERERPMSYTTEIADSLAENLERFATLNKHQLAGHVANIEFWLDEVRHCLSIIGGYSSRFSAMKAAQMKYVAEHDTRELSPTPSPWCSCCGPRTRTASLPARPPETEIKDARNRLRDSAYRFLVRCHKTGFIDEQTLRDAADSIGTGVDLADLVR